MPVTPTEKVIFIGPAERKNTSPLHNSAGLAGQRPTFQFSVLANRKPLVAVRGTFGVRGYECCCTKKEDLSLRRAAESLS